MTPRPSFLIHYHRTFDENSNFLDNWYQYNKDMVLADYQSGLINQHLSELSFQHRHTIDKLSQKINHGFSILSKDLGSINTNIKFVSDRIELSNQLQVATNLLLEDIKELLKIPDIEKQRVHYIQEGLKFLTHVESNEDFYEDAYNEFKKAEALKDNDYLTVYNLGMIELYSLKHMNISLAKSRFDKAIKYSIIDSDNELLKYLNNLFNSTYGISDNKEKYFTSNLYSLSAQCSYILGNDLEAFETLKKGLALVKSGNNYFFIAKYALRCNKVEEALEYIEKILQFRDYDLIEKVINDFDFISQEEVVSRIENFVLNIESLFSQFTLKKYIDRHFKTYNFVSEDIEKNKSSLKGILYILNKYNQKYFDKQKLKEEKIFKIEMEIDDAEKRIIEAKNNLDPGLKRQEAVKKMKEELENELQIIKNATIVAALFALLIFVFSVFDLIMVSLGFSFLSVPGLLLIGYFIYNYKDKKYSKLCSEGSKLYEKIQDYEDDIPYRESIKRSLLVDLKVELSKLFIDEGQIFREDDIYIVDQFEKKFVFFIEKTMTDEECQYYKDKFFKNLKRQDQGRYQCYSSKYPGLFNIFQW